MIPNTDSESDRKTSFFIQGIKDLQKSQNHHKNHNHKKIVLEKGVREILRSRLEHEYKLYDFITNRIQEEILNCEVL